MVLGSIVTWDMISQKKNSKPQLAVLSRKNMSLCMLFQTCLIMYNIIFTFSNTIKYSCDLLQLEYCVVTQKHCLTILFTCTVYGNVSSVLCVTGAYPVGVPYANTTCCVHTH